MAETKRQFEEKTGARDRRGLLADRRHDGVLRQPGAGHQQDRIDRHAAARRRSADRRCRERRGEPAGGEVGELILRAPQHMSEYWNNPLETAETLRSTATGGPWVHTGDLAYMDEDGYVFLVDRKKDMMKTSGFQVWPREIEEVISAHPAVLEVGVAGVPDAVKGEVAKAWVVLKRGQTADRRRAARVLPRASRAVQGAGARGVPDGAAEDDGGQGAAARARRGDSRDRS